MWRSPCRFYTPLPQLTADCDRVAIIGLQTSDVIDYDTLNHIKIGQLLQEIRICEDYCLSDIYILDFAKYSLGHVPKISLPLLRKLQLCSLVSIENCALYMHKNIKLQVALQDLWCSQYSVLRQITSCSPLRVNRHFGGSSLLCLQGWIVSGWRNQHEASFACFLLHGGFFFGLFFNPEVGGDLLFRKIWLIFNKLSPWEKVRYYKTTSDFICKNLLWFIQNI